MPDGKITFGNSMWSSTSHKATVTITNGAGNGFSLYYGTSDGTIDTRIESGAATSEYELNTIIYAQLADTANNRSKSATTTIKDADNPQSASIQFSTNSADVNQQITATVVQTDNESGVDPANSKWIYDTNSGILGVDAYASATAFTLASEDITLTAASAGTYYLHVLTVDKAGKQTETVSSTSVQINEKINTFSFYTNLVTFKYTYEVGMTWKDFINSKYNILQTLDYGETWQNNKLTCRGFSVYEDRVKVSYGDMAAIHYVKTMSGGKSTFMKPDDLIDGTLKYQ